LRPDFGPLPQQSETATLLSTAQLSLLHKLRHTSNSQYGCSTKLNGYFNHANELRMNIKKLRRKINKLIKSNLIICQFTLK